MEQYRTHTTDVREVYGFELRDKVVTEAFQESSRSYVIEFADGTRIRMISRDNEIHIQKLTTR